MGSGSRLLVLSAHAHYNYTVPILAPCLINIIKGGWLLKLEENGEKY